MKKNMNAERFQKIASGIQSVVLAAAVLIGGGWTLYTFNKLHEIEQRQLDLEAKQRLLKERAILNINLIPEQLSNDGKSPIHVGVTVKIENKGNKTEIMLWKTTKIQAARVTFNSKGQPVHGKLYNGKYSPVDEEIQPVSEGIIPGLTKRYSFLFGFDKPGTYHIEFYTVLSEQARKEREIEERLVDTNSDGYLWYESVFIQVK